MATSNPSWSIDRRNGSTWRRHASGSPGYSPHSRRGPGTPTAVLVSVGKYWRCGASLFVTVCLISAPMDRPLLCYQQSRARGPRRSALYVLETEIEIEIEQSRAQTTPDHAG